VNFGGNFRSGLIQGWVQNLSALRLIADRGYSYLSCRLLLRRRGIRHTIPERRDQREHRAGRRGVPPGFDFDIYRKRNVVERCVNHFSLRVFLNSGEQPRRYESDFARRRSGVRIPSAPL
jgi:transposase